MYDFCIYLSTFRMMATPAVPQAATTTAATSAPKVVLPPNIESMIQENKYNLEAYALLIKEAQSRKIEDARQLYEFLVETFPLSGRFWKLYIEHEMKLGTREKVEKLFQRCLSKVLHIELWRCYLNYIKVSTSKTVLLSLNRTKVKQLNKTPFGSFAHPGGHFCFSFSPLLVFRKRKAV